MAADAARARKQGSQQWACFSLLFFKLFMFVFFGFFVCSDPSKTMVRLQLMEIPDDVLALILAACTVSELHCLAATSKRIKETSDERRRLIAVLEPFKKTFIGVLTCSDRMRLTARKLGDAEMQALSTALTGGAMAQLEVLYLTKNQIGDAGIQAFSTAIASGAMAQLKVSWRPSPLLGSLETWHAHSPDPDILFDDTGTVAQQQHHWRCRG
tara:strand:- start:830 stop:1465 length:636 start_codon:yes stop_codon:yes gene_type:complete